MIGLTGLFRTESEETCKLMEIQEVELPGCSDPGFLETFLFGSLIAAVDPVAVLAVFDEIKAQQLAIRKT